MYKKKEEKNVFCGFGEGGDLFSYKKSLSLSLSPPPQPRREINFQKERMGGIPRDSVDKYTRKTKKLNSERNVLFQHKPKKCASNMLI